MTTACNKKLGAKAPVFLLFPCNIPGASPIDYLLEYRSLGKAPLPNDLGGEISRCTLLFDHPAASRHPSVEGNLVFSHRGLSSPSVGWVVHVV